MSDDDDLPPLLDETELVEQIINRKKQRSAPKTSNELLELEKGDFIPDLIKSEITPSRQEVEKPKAKPGLEY